MRYGERRDRQLQVSLVFTSSEAIFYGLVRANQSFHPISAQMIDRCTWWRLSLSKYEGGQENGNWLRTRIAWRTDPFILDSLGLGMNGTNQKCKSRKRSRETTRGATTRTNVEKVLGMNRVGSPAIIPKCREKGREWEIKKMKVRKK